jgi:adenylyltransferase/sulfurtransferase
MDISETDSSLTSLSPDQRQRFGRHLVLPHIGEEGQLRLSSAKVLCIGAGGLGSPVLMYLAAAGIGTIGIVDFDKVDLSNLQRQVIHGESDVGTPKIESARRRINAINSSAIVNLYSEGINVHNASEIISHYDLVIDATDNFATRYLINDACVIARKPCIWGSVYRFDGQLSVFGMSDGPCYRCLHPEPPAKELAPNCAVGGVFGVLCGTIGSLQATEAIKIITGAGEPLVGSLLAYDALTTTFETIRLNKNPECSVCSPAPTQTALLDDYEAFCSASLFDHQSGEVPEISVEELVAMKNSSADFQLIDVRELEEWNVGYIEGAVHIPQQQILSGQALDLILKQRPVALYCHSGIRSASCAQALLDQGFNQVVTLTGGIQAWDLYSTHV